jgi:hypothetical protein
MPYFGCGRRSGGIPYIGFMRSSAVVEAVGVGFTEALVLGVALADVVGGGEGMPYSAATSRGAVAVAVAVVVAVVVVAAVVELVAVEEGDFAAESVVTVASDEQPAASVTSAAPTTPRERPRRAQNGHSVSARTWRLHEGQGSRAMNGTLQAAELGRHLSPTTGRRLDSWVGLELARADRRTDGTAANLVVDPRRGELSRGRDDRRDDPGL